MDINKIDQVILDNAVNGMYRLAPFYSKWNEETKRNEKFPAFKEWNGNTHWQDYATRDLDELQRMLDKCTDDVLLQAVCDNCFFLEADMHADKKTGEIANGGGLATFGKWDAEFEYTQTLTIQTPTNDGQRRAYSKPSGTYTGETMLVTPYKEFNQIQTLVTAGIVWGKGYETLDASPIAYRPDYLYGIVEVPVKQMGQKEYENTPEEEILVAEACIKSLKRFRSDDRECWIDVLLILKGMQDQVKAKKLAIEFSKECRSKWADEEYKFDNTWDTLPEPHSIGLGSLVYMAQEDDVDFEHPLSKPKTSISIGDGEVVDVPKIKTLPTISDEKLEEFIKIEKDSLSDWGNAMRLIYLYGDKLRYNASFNWIIWNGVKWEIDPDNSDALAHHYSHLTARSIRVEAARITKESVAEAWGNWAHQSHSSYHLEKMLEEAKTELTRKTEVFYDNHHWLLNVENGILDLKTGALMAHDRKYHITKVAGTSFNPDAKCPRWEAFMELIFPNPEVRRFVQVAVGYSLTGNSDEREFFFLYDREGKGDNGKSTFIRVLLYVFGEYGTSTSIDSVLASQRGGLTPYNEDFMNRRFVSTDELPENVHMSTNTMKKLTGNDIIECNPKHRKPFKFPPTHALWIFGNKLPVPDNKNDLPFFERMKPIAFEHKIPSEIKKPMEQVLDGFREELSGILNWALEGLKIYMAEGLKDPATVKEDAKAYQDEYDYFTQFLEQYVVEFGNSKLQTRINVFCSQYNNFLEENNERPISKIAIGKKLKSLGVVVGGQGNLYYEGIAPNTSNPSADNKKTSIGKDDQHKSPPKIGSADEDIDL